MFACLPLQQQQQDGMLTFHQKLPCLSVCCTCPIPTTAASLLQLLLSMHSTSDAPAKHAWRLVLQRVVSFC